MKWRNTTYSEDSYIGIHFVRKLLLVSIYGRMQETDKRRVKIYGKETLGQIKDDEANKIWTFKTF